jgi:hypothetical protein
LFEAVHEGEDVEVCGRCGDGSQINLMIHPAILIGRIEYKYNQSINTTVVRI